MAGKRKGKTIRKRGLFHREKAIARKKNKHNRFKRSKWKLQFPGIFKVIDYYPFIVRKDDERFQ